MRKFKLIQEYPNSQGLNAEYTEREPDHRGEIYFVNGGSLICEADILDKRYFKEIVSFENESRKVIRQMLETLEKFLTHDELNHKVIDSINDDIDYLYVNYLKYEPDGDNQIKLKHNLGVSDIDAIHLLSTRICNTLQTI